MIKDELRKKLKIKSSKFILGESTNELKKIESCSVDMAFCDPPYNLQLNKDLLRPNMTKVYGVDDSWDKFADFEEYDRFTKNWLCEIKRVLKKDASIWVIGTYHNIYRIGYILQNLGFWILNDIVWRKTNPMPNFKGTRFTNAHETLIWATKSKFSKYTFNYKTMKLLNNGKQMRSDWLINVCSGKERLKDENDKKLHNAQKPEELLQKIILSSTNPSDLIIDPFFGTGTTGVVCKRLGRHFIGIEKNPNYIKEAKTRIMKTKRLDTRKLESVNKEKKLPKVPFEILIKKGIIKAGDSLYDAKKKYKAIVLANGKIRFNKKTGSIHQIGAMVQSKVACNGWDFWFTAHKKKLVSINNHRIFFNSM